MAYTYVDLFVSYNSIFLLLRKTLAKNTYIFLNVSRSLTVENTNCHRDNAVVLRNFCKLIVLEDRIRIAWRAATSSVICQQDK
jgi:hypothetical protein